MMNRTLAKQIQSVLQEGQRSLAVGIEKIDSKVNQLLQEERDKTLAEADMRLGELHIKPFSQALIGCKEAKMKDALAWLKAPDFQANHENARALEQEGTGQWFLQSEKFRTWVLGKDSNLWVQAIRMFFPAFSISRLILTRSWCWQNNSLVS
jgi:hypothetical protein